jgi:uncharacterized damage-inducible protein DinB
MNKQMLSGQWQFFRMVVGLTRKLVEQIPADKLDFRPTPEIRSVSEIVTHMYNMLTDAVNTVREGKPVMGEEPIFTDKTMLLKWMDSQVDTAFAGFEELTDAQLAVKMDCWGDTFDAWQFLDFCYQEHLHHRGQLTVYLRLLGIQPFFIYDFENASVA